MMGGDAGQNMSLSHQGTDLLPAAETTLETTFASTDVVRGDFVFYLVMSFTVVILALSSKAKS